MKLQPFLKKYGYVKWYIIAIVIFFLAMFLTPINFCKNHTLFVSFATTIVCASFVLAGALKFDNFQDIFYHDYKNEFSILAAALPVCTVLIGAIILGLVFSTRIDTALMKNGEVVEGYISNKEFKRDTRNSTRYRLTVSFKDKYKKGYRFTEEVSSDVYGSVYEGMKVEVKYMKDDPSIFRIIAGDANVGKFVKETSNRDITFADLEKLFVIPKDSVLEYLSSINYKWDEQQGTEVTIYINKLRGEKVGIRNDGSVTFSGKNTVQSQYFIPRGEVLETNVDYSSTRRGTNRFYKTKDFTIIDSLQIGDNLKVNQYLLIIPNKKE